VCCSDCRVLGLPEGEFSASRHMNTAHTVCASSVIVHVIAQYTKHIESAVEIDEIADQYLF
jgi:hypothetical protein